MKIVGDAPRQMIKPYWKTEVGSEELTYSACKICSKKSQSEAVVSAIKAA